MVKRQADRLKEVVTELISTASKTVAGGVYEGDIAKDYPREWNKILRVTGLHPDSNKPSPKNIFKENTFVPLMAVTELSDAAIGSFIVVASAIDEEYLPLKVTSFDNSKQIVTGILHGDYEIGFSYKSIRGYKA
jgi:hypothetical protein